MENHIRYNINGNAVSFAGPDAVAVYAMAVLASGLRLYARTGMRPNRHYTPTAMMRAAERHLGRTFKARDYIAAADALSAKVQAEKLRLSEGK